MRALSRPRTPARAPAQPSSSGPGTPGAGSAPSSAVITRPVSLVLTATCSGESQPIATTAPYNTWPSGTSVCATASCTCAPMSPARELLDERLHVGVVAQRYRRLAELAARRGDRDGVHELELDRPVGRPAGGSAVSTRRAGRCRVLRCSTRVVVPAGTQPGDEQQCGQEGSEKAPHGDGTVAAATGFRQAARMPAPQRRGFTRAELESFRDAAVPDLLPALTRHDLEAALRRDQPRPLDRGHPDPLRPPGEPLLPGAPGRRHHRTARSTPRPG